MSEHLFWKMNRPQSDLGSTHIGKPHVDRQISELATEHKVDATVPDFCEVLVHNHGEHEN